MYSSTFVYYGSVKTEKSIDLVPAGSSGFIQFFICKFLDSYDGWFTNFSSVTGSREMILVFIQTCFELNFCYFLWLKLIDKWLCELNVNCAGFEAYVLGRCLQNICVAILNDFL